MTTSMRILLAGTGLLAMPAFAQMTAPAASAQPAASTPAQSGGMMATTDTSGGAPAGASGAVVQGATVYDAQGGVVGRVDSVNGDMVVLATQKTKVQLPKSSFAAGPKGPAIAMTAAQLNQAAAQATGGAAGAAGATTPNVVQGAAVTDTKGGAVGTVSDVDAQYATVILTTGGKVRLPVNAFGAGSNGGLRVAMTAAQLQAAGAAAGGTAASGSTTPGGGQ